jgi:type III secretion protein J
MTAMHALRAPFAALSSLRRALLVLCLAGVLSACKAELYTGLGEQEANEIMAILIREQIDARRSRAEDGTLTILVEKERFADAVEILGAKGYPRRTFASMGEVFRGDRFVLSPTEERARLIFAITEELSRTISDIDGVLTARTHVVLPTNDLLSGSFTPSSASVFIRHRDDAQLQPMIPHIRMLVTNSIEGLAFDNVSVVLVPVKAPELPVVPPAAAKDAVPDPLGAAGTVQLTGLASILAVIVVFLGLRRIGPLLWARRRLRQSALIRPPQEPAPVIRE